MWVAGCDLIDYNSMPTRLRWFGVDASIRFHQFRSLSATKTSINQSTHLFVYNSHSGWLKKTHTHKLHPSPQFEIWASTLTPTFPVLLPVLLNQPSCCWLAHMTVRTCWGRWRHKQDNGPSSTESELLHLVSCHYDHRTNVALQLHKHRRR